MGRAEGQPGTWLTTMRWLIALWTTMTGRDMPETPGDRMAAILDRTPKPRPIRELVDMRADCHASGAVMLAAYIIRGDQEFSLCGHHLAKHRARLTEQGWRVLPIERGTAATGTGTEATPAHFALEG